MNYVATLVVAMMAFNSNAQTPSDLTDTTPPTLTFFEFFPNIVDVTTGDATVDFTVGATDDLSGIESINVTFYSPSFGQSVQGTIYSFSTDPLNVQDTGSLTIPQFGEAGDWFAQISLRDRTGNSQFIDNVTLQTLGFPTILTVVSGAPDTTPPEVTSLSFEPTVINVSSGPQSIAFTLGLSDSPAGVTFDCNPFCYVGFDLVSPSGNQVQREVDMNFMQISGNAENGIWQIIVTLPQYAEAGEWNINRLIVRDTAGNTNFVSKSQLQAKGYPTAFTVVSSPSDTQAPQLTNFTIAPTFIDTTQSNAAITYNLQITDDLSGVDYIYSSISPNAFREIYVYANSPSGNQHIYASANENSLIAGTSTNGTFQASGNLAQFSEAGTWKINSVFLVDNAGNNTLISNTQLNNLGFPNSFEVILPSLVVDGATDPNTSTTIMDQVFGERAQVIVDVGVFSEPVEVSIDVLSTDLNLPIPSGFSVAGTNFVNINLDPHPVAPYPAPGVTLVLPVNNQTPPGTVLTLYRVDPVSGNLTPEPSVNLGEPVTGIVNADGLSATFTGVAALSTVVGLVPTGEVLGDLNGDSLVNCFDIAIVKNAYGKRLGEEGFDSRADTNKDNIINIRDLAFVSRKLPSDVRCRITPTGAEQIDPNNIPQ